MSRHVHQKNQQGVVTLATTVIVFFVCLTLALSVQFLGVGELIIGFQEGQSEQAFQLADTCTNEALLRLKRLSSYTGGTLSIGTQSCTISISGSGATRTIVTTGTVGTIQRKIQIQVSLTVSGSVNIVTITDWDELTT